VNSAFHGWRIAVLIDPVFGLRQLENVANFDQPNLAVHENAICMSFIADRCVLIRRSFASSFINRILTAARFELCELF